MLDKQHECIVDVFVAVAWVQGGVTRYAKVVSL